MHLLSFSVLSIPLIHAACYDPSPFFPLPLWPHGSRTLAPAFSSIAKHLDDILAKEKYNTSSLSLSITSQTDTLWSYSHTARIQNTTRPGDQHVDEDSLYRIASITKTFTVLALLQQARAGNLSLDDPVLAYIPELTSPGYVLPWKDVTLRSLASQLSGLPREFAQADLLNEVPDPSLFGLPILSEEEKEKLPTCYEYADHRTPCNRTELLSGLKGRKPVFAPNARSTYSNLAFELLGLVIANVSGRTYEEYIQNAIFDLIDMPSSRFLAPKSDEKSVLPLGQYFFDVDEGVHNPTGGIFSTSRDLSAYLRFVLTHFNALAVGVNWLLPGSFAAGAGSFYGMPWEIFSTEKVVRGRRTTFVTKGGGVPMYFSKILLLPEYGLGITTLTGGDVGLVGEVNEVVTVGLVRAAEEAVVEDVRGRYAGSYAFEGKGMGETGMQLSVKEGKGLVLESLVVNDTDVFATLLPIYAGAAAGGEWRAQLLPTLLFKDEAAQAGEIFRIVVVPERSAKGKEEETVWEEFCITDVDPASYGGVPINEVVYWHEAGKEGEMVVELSAWRVNMSAVNTGDRVWKGGVRVQSV